MSLHLLLVLENGIWDELFDCFPDFRVIQKERYVRYTSTKLFLLFISLFLLLFNSFFLSLGYEFFHLLLDLWIVFIKLLFGNFRCC